MLFLPARAGIHQLQVLGESDLSLWASSSSNTVYDLGPNLESPATTHSGV